MVITKSTQLHKGTPSQVDASGKFYLFLIPHWAFTSNHYLTPRISLQLFGCDTSGAKNSSHEVELQYNKRKACQTYYSCPQQLAEKSSLL